MQEEVRPVPQPRGGSIRFAVGSANGMRSASWTVFGSRNSADVYVSSRNMAQRLKISLHQSGDWRVAFVREYADAHGIQDRVLHRFGPPEEIVPGWWRAVTIVVPGNALRSAVQEKALSKRAPVVWAPPSAFGETTAFEVMVSNPANPHDLTVDGVFPVGSMWLDENQLVAVLAHRNFGGEWAVEARAGAGYVRARTRETLHLPQNGATAISVDDNHVTLFDLGNVW